MSGDVAGGRAGQGGVELRVLVPDLEGAPLVTLRALEEVLLMLDAWEVDPDGSIDLPAPISGGAGLDVVARLQAVLAPTQGQTAERHGRLLAPLGEPADRHTGPGHHVYVPLSEIRVQAADVAVLSAIAAALGDPGLSSDIVLAVDELAGAEGLGVAVLVEQTARLAGLLDLAWTQDAEHVAPRLAERRPGLDVALTPAEHACFERLADRINAMATGDDLTRWLY